MLRFVLTRIGLPLLALLLLEGAFRSNWWERFAAPNSHASISIRVKQALAAEPRRIDFVTLGSSRAVYGLGHARIAALAANHGLVHANLSMPGSHWMSVIAVIDWLRSARPGVQGGIIALSISDLKTIGNGNYELAIVRPFQSLVSDRGGLSQRFDWRDPGSFGAISALYQYRRDLQDAVRHPLRRGADIGWLASLGRHQLFAGPKQPADTCALPWQTLASCSAWQPVNADQTHAVQVCRDLLVGAGMGGDWTQLDPSALPADRQRVLDQRQRELRGIGWKQPPLVILLPVTEHWSRELLPRGIRAWAHTILDPLVADGSIRLLDYSDFFDVAGHTRCDVFWDSYHQNAKGMGELTDALLPEIERQLYAP